jgi:hypothetical protein
LGTSEFPKKTCRVSGVDAWSVGISGYDRTGADYGAVTDSHRQYRGVAADRDAAADDRRLPKPSISTGWAARLKKIIDEHNAMGNGRIVANRHKLADKAVRLNSATLPNRDTPLDLNKGSDERSVPDVALVQVHWLNYGDVRSERDISNP